jgi:hypothetical protein
VGAENPVRSCSLHVLVYEAAKPVSPQWPRRCAGARGSSAWRRALAERSMRSVGVVVREVLLQDGREVSGSGDQEVVEAFAS